MTAPTWSKAIPIVLGIILGNLMVADFPLFRDYAPAWPSPITFHAAVGVIGLTWGGLTRGQGLLQGLILTLTVAFVFTWTVTLAAGSRVESGHFLDFVLWNLFSRSAFVALVDGPLLLLTALAGAAWIPISPR